MCKIKEKHRYRYGFEAELGAMNLGEKLKNKTVLAEVKKNDIPFLNIVSEGESTGSSYVEFVSAPFNDDTDICDYFMFLRYSRSATDKKYFEEIFDEILNKINRTNNKYEIIYYVKYKTLKIKRIGPTYGNFSMQINMDIPCSALYCNNNENFLNLLPSDFKKNIYKSRECVNRLFNKSEIKEISNNALSLLTILYYQCYIYTEKGNIIPPKYERSDLITNENCKLINIENNSYKLKFSVLVKAGKANIINMLEKEEVNKLKLKFDDSKVEDMFIKTINSFTLTGNKSKCDVCYNNIKNNISKCIDNTSKPNYIYDEPRPSGLIEPVNDIIVIELRSASTPFVSTAADAANCKDNEYKEKLNNFIRQIKTVDNAL